jgi:hypothetical protein
VTRHPFRRTASAVRPVLLSPVNRRTGPSKAAQRCRTANQSYVSL